MSRVAPRLAPTESERERLRYGSYREERIGSHVRRVPDVRPADLADLRFGSLPPERCSVADFGGLLRETPESWGEFFRTRKVVKHAGADGVEYASVTANMADVLHRVGEKQGELVGSGLPRVALPKAPETDSSSGIEVIPHEVATGIIPAESAIKVVIKKKKESRKYSLVQMLTDPQVMDKFELSGGLLQNVKNMAVVQPAAAARRLQEHVRTFHGMQSATVTAGDYAKTTRRAWDAIEYFASAHEAVTVAYDAKIIGDKVFLYPALSDARWRVIAPVSRTQLAILVHRMVEASTPSDVMFTFGPELVLLDVDIHNGDDFESPLRECHAGDHDDLPAWSSRSTTEVLSPAAFGRVAALGRGLATVSDGEKDVASAAWVGKGLALVNSHVLDECERVFLDGVLAAAVRQLTSDLWLVRTASGGSDFQWSLREPVPGEAVFVCYKRHTRVQYTSVVSVRDVGNSVLTMSRTSDFMPGMSGGVVLAVSDMAVLGLYDGQSLYHSIAALFSPAVYTEMCTAELRSESGRVSERGGSPSVYGRMGSKGLGVVVDAVADALDPVYEGRQRTGVVLQARGRVYTTLDPDLARMPVYAVASLSSTFAPEVGRLGLFSADGGPEAPTPRVVRAPVQGEEVFVVSKDAEGPYYSTSTVRVKHLGAQGGTFSTTILPESPVLPLQGGAVVACSDGAVVGLYVETRTVGTLGVVEWCVAFPEGAPVEPTVVQMEGVFRRAFPLAHMSAWPRGVLAEVVMAAWGGFSSHLVAVGQGALATRLAVKARAVDAPPGELDSVLGRSLEEWLLQQYEASHLVLAVGLFPGPAEPPDPLRMMRAFAGALYLYEDLRVFYDWMDTMG